MGASPRKEDKGWECGETCGVRDVNAIRRSPYLLHLGTSPTPAEMKPTVRVGTDGSSRTACAGLVGSSLITGAGL
jgi:hypothetical protein